MHRNDIFWKGLIEDLFPHFIPFFLPQHQHLFDTDKPVEFLDKELNEIATAKDSTSQTLFVDKLVKVFATNGEEKWVLVHIEVQGYSEPEFAERMFNYFLSIYKKYDKLVTAIAIYTDGSTTFGPSQHVYDFAGTTLTYQFNTYKVLQQNEQGLAESNNPFAIAILTVLLELKKKKLDDDRLLNLKVALARQLQAKGFSRKTTRQLFNFISNYVNFAKPETAIKFEEETKAFTPNNEPMGLEEQILEMKKQEGREEGLVKGEAKRSTILVENLLLSTDFSNEKIASLAAVTISFVEETRNKISQ